MKNATIYLDVDYIGFIFGFSIRTGIVAVNKEVNLYENA